MRREGDFYLLSKDKESYIGERNRCVNFTCIDGAENHVVFLHRPFLQHDS